MIDYIETLTTLVQEEIRMGAGEDDVPRLPDPEKFKDWLIEDFYVVNLRFLYRSMIPRPDPKRTRLPSPGKGAE
ncbi:MAG: hypothetical protein PHH18_09985 [Acidobacteriota bacterium]|nr:hypothetical protein [Acidobacteriota bacterium]